MGGSAPGGGLLRGGVPAPGGVPVLGGGACYWGVPAPRVVPAWRPPKKQTATVADGTHPTGMHSCFKMQKQQ